MLGRLYSVIFSQGRVSIKCAPCFSSPGGREGLRKASLPCNDYHFVGLGHTVSPATAHRAGTHPACLGTSIGLQLVTDCAAATGTVCTGSGILHRGATPPVSSSILSTHQLEMECYRVA